MTPMTPNDDFDARTYAIIGAAQEVHRCLGPGFLETVYHHALAEELRSRGIPFEMQVEVPVIYKGKPLPCNYRLDVLAYTGVVVELKALRTTGPIEEAQVINYLRASSLEVALLVNFGTPRLEVQRFANSRNSASASSADGLG